MAKNNFKLDRIAQNIKFSLNEIINEEVNDVKYVTVTDIEITKDLVDAKIYFQLLDEKDEEIITKKLEKASGFLKKRLAEELDIRKVPNLLFKYDHSLSNYNKIDQILNKKDND